LEGHGFLKLVNGIPYGEYNNVLRVLKEYNIEPKAITKVRSVYKIETHDGAKCLKKIKHGKGKPKRTYYITQYLMDRGFDKVAPFIKTSNDRLYVKHKGFYYYMTEWINGRECNIDDFEELKRCTKLLAEFHIAASGKEGKNYFKLHSNLKNWPSIFIDNCNQLLEFKALIEQKRIKSDFDNKYNNYIDYFYRQGLIAVDLLNKSDYYLISARAKESREVCHDSFYYQNLIIDESSNNIYLIDLDSTVCDIRMHDLGKFIRRIMFKTPYAWNFNKASEIIDAYNSVVHITKEELEVLLAIIIFPHKFCKLGKKRYIKKKLWSEEKYNKKIGRQIKYIDKQREFTREFIEFYDIDIDLNLYFDDVKEAK
jgi:CotS family spore coat protein